MLPSGIKSISRGWPSNSNKKVEETGVPKENHQPATSQWQTRGLSPSAEVLTEW